ncbi:hypothetical protein JB92DRAFT_2829045 [Gautieria morchelliformis]|nr:hypothetical protein JB92DRAFT_2829045 [Gautieria morchelliformis]
MNPCQLANRIPGPPIQHAAACNWLRVHEQWTVYEMLTGRRTTVLPTRKPNSGMHISRPVHRSGIRMRLTPACCGLRQSGPWLRAARARVGAARQFDTSRRPRLRSGARHDTGGMRRRTRRRGAARGEVARGTWPVPQPTPLRRAAVRVGPWTPWTMFPSFALAPGRPLLSLRQDVLYWC